MPQYRLSRLFIALGLSISSTAALASPQAFMSSRSFAMGGTGVAVANPSSATSSNPAMMAADHHTWSDEFGLTLPSINARVADEEETIDQVDDIQDTIDDLETAINSSNTAGAQQLAGQLREQFEGFDKDTVRADIGLGLALAVPGKKLSVGLFSNGNLTATIRGEYDESDDAKLEAIENGILIPGATDDLQSRGRALASAVIEAGVSFAHALELSNGETLQLGISPKYVELRTFQYTETVSGFEDDEFDNDQYQTSKSGFNLDIGAAYAFGDAKQWNAGIAIKNLIPMELDSAAIRPELGEQVRTLELNPMATLGIAHKSTYHVVTAEVDLTKKEAFGFEDDTQWLALGAEFDAWRYAQLRAGVRHNLASNDDNDGIAEETQFTVGLGLNLMGVRFDLGALYSSAEVGAALELGTSF
ncbi:conjugal transfer protein TraF [Marinobacter sp. 2_MG-2023]|uniref:conjugal transfer protein TraF n=1 Tax=Marinobacter sp. 2_MG-2023 TaxID=3062679 RepID=UPI0026E14921|nr:conjugal transfer protein TraF [Marinobacter sp. 2_MG-2023]MDO6443072.1 conjugal transfer protein TraF [Marinobacter sp. 2_MG-2023]